jgi:hypothetical protein
MKRKTSPQKKLAVASQRKIDANELPVIAPEQARPLMRALLLANPNYFGTVKNSPIKPVLGIQEDTSYEELDCIGFQPQLSRLEAVVYVKQQSGYDGGICTDGSQEYVRFYLSFNNGVTWQDQGISSFTAYDIPGNGRLEYAVTLPINPPESFCLVESLPLVRGILSWNYPPPANAPAFVPVWGNVVEAQIQIKPRHLIIFNELLTQAKVKLPAAFSAAIDLTQSVSTATPKSLTAAELQELYKDKNVPASRFLFTEIQNQTAAVPTAQTAKTWVDLSSSSINWPVIIGPIFNPNGNTSYEQLDCIGFDPNRDVLVGVVQVKLPTGYLGGLCTAGSTEYVAFWIDWNDGTGWIYAGTASVSVHDIKTIPKSGLEYAVCLPLDDANRRKLCTAGAVTPQVRAILSWQTAPPPSNPNYVPTWGNQLETRIQIYPGAAVPPGTADISIIGGVGIGDIDVTNSGLTLPGATFALNNSPTDPWGQKRQSPFCGTVTVQGVATLGYYYRVLVRQAGTLTSFPVVTPFSTVDWLGNGTLRSPLDAAGHFAYVPNAQNTDNLLAAWSASGGALWEVSLELSEEILGIFNVVSQTPWYRIQLNSTAPFVDIHIDTGAGDCASFAVGTTITGHFVATSAYFGDFGLSVEPNTTAFPSNSPTPATGTSATAAAPGGNPWSLSLASPTKMSPCGYTVTVCATDLTIVNSAYVGLQSCKPTGFCLVA